MIFLPECRLAAVDDFWLDADEEEEELQEFVCRGISQDETVDDEAVADDDVAAGAVTVATGSATGGTACDGGLEMLTSDEFSFWSSRSEAAVVDVAKFSLPTADADVVAAGPENRSHSKRLSNGRSLRKSKL